MLLSLLFFFFFNHTATTEIYTLSLHDALPISYGDARVQERAAVTAGLRIARADRRRVLELVLLERQLSAAGVQGRAGDRKSTRLNSSHLGISYAVFCLKKKKYKQTFSSMTENS